MTGTGATPASGATPGGDGATPASPAPPAAGPRRPVVLRHVDRWDELAGRIAADRAVGLSPSPVRRALTAWFDAGSFTETGTLARRAVTSYRGGDVVEEAGSSFVAADGLVAGWGRRGGQLVFVAADDPSLGSSVRGGAGAAKAGRMRHHALNQSAALVQVFAADRVEPGVFVGAEVVRSGYGVDLDAERQTAERILKIGIVTHPIQGPAALEAGWCHVVLLAGPDAAIEGLAGDAAVAAGLADRLCPDLDAAFAVAGELLDHLPPSRFDPAPLTPAGGGEPAGCGDPAGGGGWAFETRPGAGGGSLATWLVAVGAPAGVAGVAEMGGELGAAAAGRVARLARLCRDLHLPLVLLHDGWRRPARPTRSDVDEHRRLGRLLRTCPALVEVASGRLQVERAWGFRPTVTATTGPVVSGGDGDSPDLVIRREQVTATIQAVVGSLALDRPAPHDDVRIRRLLPRRLQSE